MTQPEEDQEEWRGHLKIALKGLEKKKDPIDLAWQYYDGDHPKVWITEAIRKKLHDRLISNMAENWIDQAINARVRRLAVDSFAGVDSATNAAAVAAQDIFDDNRLKLGQKDIYKAADVAGESFLFAWQDESKEYGIDATIKDARNVWWPPGVHSADPDRVVLVWADEEEEIWRATIYYPETVVRLVGPKVSTGGGWPAARYFSVDPDEPGGEHGFDRVPVVRFAKESARRSHVDAIRPLQDKINKLAANLLVTAEFNAWRKLIILTEQQINDGDVQFRPDRINVLDPGGGEDGGAPTSIWEGSATELKNFSDEQDRLIDKVFTKSDLPGHLKVASGKVLPSGAAYEADEGPYTEFLKDCQEAYGESWRQFWDIVLGVDVEAQWRNPHVKSDQDEMVAVKTAVDAGMPLSLALKYYAFWSPEQLKELEEQPLSPKEQVSMAAAMALQGAPRSTPPEEQEGNTDADDL